MSRTAFLLSGLVMVAGCTPTATEALAPSTRTVQRPAPLSPTESEVEISWDTSRDRRFAEFLREKSGGMIRKAAVGLDRKGELRVQLDRSVEPDDTLPLTKSLMSGARKDFPDQPITLSVYDPDGEPILKALYRPGEGVRYQIAKGGPTRDREEAGKAKERKGRDAEETLARGGVTPRDREFAAWAEEHGRPFLRYVEADLERHGRLWFGITREVDPDDLPELTQSLLRGARKEFPRRELVATVFDPEGERIGRARLLRDGSVRWER
ncbi:MAG: hypothetical protein IRY99_10365 [Isosphaeraceae bacterium]|nr:hypothetical protein [Isosphaeraceae bacterium]